MNKISKFLLGAALLYSTSVLTSCKKDEIEVEGTKVEKMAGEWYVKYELPNASGQYEDPYGIGYTKLLTSNTADNTDDKMWIGDVFVNPREVNTAKGIGGNFWTYMVKANVNISEMTFNADSKSIVIDDGAPYDINVKITDGKILKDGARPPSKTTTDSIVFMVEFEDDPGNVYRASGYRRTGFLEDEH